MAGGNDRWQRLQEGGAGLWAHGGVDGLLLCNRSGKDRSRGAGLGELVKLSHDPQWWLRIDERDHNREECGVEAKPTVVVSSQKGAGWRR